MHQTQVDYNFPLADKNGYFYGKIAPSLTLYQKTYLADFLRYLYFICIIGGDGSYPIDKSIEDILVEFKNLKKGTCEGKIKKILIGEAPPPNYNNYFYNIRGFWPARTVWISQVSVALFPGIIFATKIDFLRACAKAGFLLLDLFPFAIVYPNRGDKGYILACTSTYNMDLLATLDWLSPCIDRNFGIGFGLKSMGEAVLMDPLCVIKFDTWVMKNGKTLNPIGSIALHRGVAIVSCSIFLRVCLTRGSFGPNARLLNMAGF